MAMVLFHYVIESSELSVGLTVPGSVEARRTHSCN